jgi:glycosyltransferase involved in cell wall biosynthesis
LRATSERHNVRVGRAEVCRLPANDVRSMMRVLQVNKFFYVRGGSERYFFDLCGLLSERGHDVIHFSMQHPRNQASGQQKYFVSEIDLNSPMGVTKRVQAALRVLYSSEAKGRMSALLDELKPDVIHFHNITRQLSPSIIDAAESRGIPMLETMHDLSLVCPAHSFFVDGHACENCAGGSYWHAVPARCIDGSLVSSLLGAFEAYLHSWLGLYKKINVFVAPSLFLKNKVSSLDWMRDKVIHLPYFIPPGPDYASTNDGYVLFAGRISWEKGVGTLLEAAERLRNRRVVIAGEGPPLEDFRRLAARKGLSNVEFAGYVKGDGLDQLLRGCSCVVVPSIAYENLPLSILEAFARGKPVVASDCGGIPELVIDGVTGYLFERGDAVTLAAAIEKAVADEAKRSGMGKRARELVSNHYSPGCHYDKLISIYEGLL